VPVGGRPLDIKAGYRSSIQGPGEAMWSNHEGGIATPCIVLWPAVIQRTGAISHDPAHIVDMMATCLDLAGVPYPEQFRGRSLLPLAGRSLLPDFLGKPIGEPRALYWATSGNRAVRIGPWKLVSAQGGPWELYNLRDDRTELHDLAGQHPDRVETMVAAFNRWRQGTPGID